MKKHTNRIFWRILFPAQVVSTVVIGLAAVLALMSVVGIVYNPAGQLFFWVFSFKDGHVYKNLSELVDFSVDRLLEQGMLLLFYVSWIALFFNIVVVATAKAMNFLAEVYTTFFTSSKEKEILKRRESIGRIRLIKKKKLDKENLQVAELAHWEQWKKTNDSQISFEDWKKSYLRQI